MEKGEKASEVYAPDTGCIGEDDPVAWARELKAAAERSRRRIWIRGTVLVILSYLGASLAAWGLLYVIFPFLF